MGKVKYKISVCKYDGKSYRFPVTKPLIIKDIGALVEALDKKRQKASRHWIDVAMPPELTSGTAAWVKNGPFILDMKCRIDDFVREESVGRFSYNPDTKEFLPGGIWTAHAETIHQFGSSPYTYYVRGVYVQKKRIVLLRPYFNPRDKNGNFDPYGDYDQEEDRKKMLLTIKMLIKNGLPLNLRLLLNVNNEVIKNYDERAKP